MSDGANGQKKTWQEVAREASSERDPEKLNLLVEELLRILGEEQAAIKQRISANLASANRSGD